MIKISLLDLLLRVIPESFLFIFASYLFCNKKFDKKRIILSTLIFSNITYFIRLFPIQFGVHIILNIIVFIILCININKIPFAKSVNYSLILVSMLSLSEKLNIIILNNVFNGNIKPILNDDILKNIYIIPSMFLFLLGILICYKLLYKNKEKKFI